MRNLLRPKQVLIALATLTLVSAAAVSAYAALPPRDVPPTTVPTGTLVGKTSLDVLSLAAFEKALNRAHGTNVVVQHLVWAPGQSTLWHTHAGPNLVLLVSGQFTLTDSHCHSTTYADGQGFATGLDKHLAVAGPAGADFYSIFILPGDAVDLRDPAPGQSLEPPRCARDD